MTFAPQNAFEPPLPETLDMAEEFEAFRRQFMPLYETVATKINQKDRGFYPLTEILNDQRFFSTDPQVYRNVFRKVFSIGAVAAGATLNTAHGITGFVELTRLYGTVITATVDYRPVPYASVTAANQGIELNLTGANIVLINGAAAPNITSGILVCEYLKQS